MFRKKFKCRVIISNAGRLILTDNAESSSPKDMSDRGTGGRKKGRNLWLYRGSHESLVVTGDDGALLAVAAAAAPLVYPTMRGTRTAARTVAVPVQ